MKTRGIIWAVIVLLLTSAGATNAQDVKKQFFAGFGTTAGRNGAPSSVNLTEGVALVVPVAKMFIVRPFVGIGLFQPTVAGKSSALSAQLGVVAGPKINSNFALLGGVSEAMVFFPDAPDAYLPTAMFATFTKVNKKTGIITPVTFNQKGIGVSLLFAYNWAD